MSAFRVDVTVRTWRPPGLGETPPRPIHRRRARAAFHNSVLLLSRTARQTPPNNATVRPFNQLVPRLPQATLDRGDAFGTVHSNRAVDTRPHPDNRHASLRHSPSVL